MKFTVLLVLSIGFVGPVAAEKPKPKGTANEDELVAMIQDLFRTGTVPTSQQILKDWNCLTIEAMQGVYAINQQDYFYSFSAFGHLIQDYGQNSEVPWRITATSFYSDSFEDIQGVDPAVTKVGRISPKGSLIVEYTTSDEYVGTVAGQAVSDPALFVYRYAMCTAAP